MPKLQEPTAAIRNCPCSRRLSNPGPARAECGCFGVGGMAWCLGVGGTAQCVGLGKLELLCSPNRLDQASFDLCWCSSELSNMLHLLAGLIIWDQVWYLWGYFLLYWTWINCVGLKRRQNGLESIQMHYLVAIIVLVSLTKFHIQVTK